MARVLVAGRKIGGPAGAESRQPLGQFGRAGGKRAGDGLDAAAALFALGRVHQDLRQHRRQRCAGDPRAATASAYGQPRPFWLRPDRRCPATAPAARRTPRQTAPCGAQGCAPMRRLNRWVPDQPGMMPSEGSGRPMRTWSSAMRRSAQAASSSPPPRQCPFRTAITGIVSRASAPKGLMPVAQPVPARPLATTRTTPRYRPRR